MNNSILPPTQQGWLCPKCGSAHAPSVMTCPMSLPNLTPNPPFTPSPYPPMMDCGCPAGAVCMNVACSRRGFTGTVSGPLTSDPK